MRASGSGESVWKNTSPDRANMNMISMFQPTMVRKAVLPGAVQRAERCVRHRIQPFTVSFTKSMPKTVRPAQMASQRPVLRAAAISRAYT